MAKPDGIYVCDVTEIEDGAGLAFNEDITGADRVISVFRDGDELFAIDDLCTHENVSLADGFVESGRVECPLHSAEFCLRTGAAMSLPAVKPVSVHGVEVREGKVFLYPA